MDFRSWSLLFTDVCTAPREVTERSLDCLTETHIFPPAVSLEWKTMVTIFQINYHQLPESTKLELLSTFTRAAPSWCELRNGCNAIVVLRGWWSDKELLSSFRSFVYGRKSIVLASQEQDGSSCFVFIVRMPKPGGFRPSCLRTTDWLSRVFSHGCGGYARLMTNSTAVNWGAVWFKAARFW